MSYLYTYNAPAEIRDEVMFTDRFYVPNTRAGVKTAMVLETMPRREKIALFKEAADDGDLAAALIRLKDKADKEDAASSAEKEDDYGQSHFIEGEREDEDEEEKDEEEKDEDEKDEDEKDEDEKDEEEKDEDEEEED